MSQSFVTRPVSLIALILLPISLCACGGGGGGGKPSNDPVLAFGSLESSVLEAAGTASITVGLSKAATKTVSIPFTLGGTAVEGTDYQLTSANPLVIAEGDTEATIEFSIADNTNFSGSRTITVTLDDASGADLPAEVVHTLRILDDEFLVSFPSATTAVADGSGAFEISILFSHSQTADVEIPLTLGGSAVAGVGKDYVAPTMPIVMPAGDDFFQLELEVLDSDAMFVGTRTIELQLGLPVRGVLGPNPLHTIEITYLPHAEVEPNNDAPAAVLLGSVGTMLASTIYQITGDMTAVAPTDQVDVFLVEAGEDLHGRFTLTPDGPGADVWVWLTQVNGVPLLPWSNPNGAGLAEVVELDFTAGQQFLLVAFCLSSETNYTIDLEGSAPQPAPSSPPPGAGEQPPLGSGYYQWLRTHGLELGSPEILGRQRLRSFDEQGRMLGDYQFTLERR